MHCGVSSALWGQEYRAVYAHMCKAQMMTPGTPLCHAPPYPSEQDISLNLKLLSFQPNKQALVILLSPHCTHTPPPQCWGCRGTRKRTSCLCSSYEPSPLTSTVPSTTRRPNNAPCDKNFHFFPSIGKCFMNSKKSPLPMRPVAPASSQDRP